MSKYTTEVRYICETAAGLTESVGYSGIDDVLDAAIPNIFDFEYPIFDEEYRELLEKKILRHYYTREICEETVGLWKLRLQDKMNLIMPYYNQMYKSELIKFNPMYDVDVTRTNTGIRNNEQNSDIDNSSVSSNTNVNENETSRANNAVNTGHTGTHEDSWDKYSDTPQGAVTGLANDEYLTNARHVEANGDADNINTSTIKDDEKSKGTSNGIRTDNSKTKGKNIFNGIENYIEKVSGKQGVTSYSKLLEEFRRTFLNIDSMVIDELSDLFFGLW